MKFLLIVVISGVVELLLTAMRSGYFIVMPTTVQVTKEDCFAQKTMLDVVWWNFEGIIDYFEIVYLFRLSGIVVVELNN